MIIWYLHPSAFLEERKKKDEGIFQLLQLLHFTFEITLKSRGTDINCHYGNNTCYSTLRLDKILTKVNFLMSCGSLFYILDEEK